MNRITKIIFLLTFLILQFFSCVSFREGTVKEYNEFPVNNKHKSVNILLTGNYIVDGTEKLYHESDMIKKDYDEVWVNSTKNAYEKCGIFLQVNLKFISEPFSGNEMKNDSDVSIEINIKNSEDLSRFGFVCYTLFVCSAGIIPAYYDEKIELTAVIKTKNYNEINKYYRSETIQTVYHLSMIFVMPFTDLNELRGNPFKYEKVYYDMNMDIIKQAYDEGIL